MFTIKLGIPIKATGDKVFEVLQDMTKFPKIMNHISRIEVENIKDDEKITHWHVDIEDASISWKERDKYDYKKKEISFSLIEGDFTGYHGRWYLENANNNTKLNMDVTYDWGIPSFEKIIGPVLIKKTKRIVMGMLVSIKRYIECQKN